MEDDLRGRFRRVGIDDVSDKRLSPRQSFHKPASHPAATAISKPSVGRKSEKHHRFGRKFIVIAGLVILLGTGLGGFFYLRSHRAKPAAAVSGQHYFPSFITNSQVNIPVYYPVGLPSGFSIGSYSVIKQNVLYYVVTNGTGDKFYVTTQPLPVSFDFVGFAKKFNQPDQYQTPIGSDLVGLAGGDLIGSIQTSQNVWIILNASGVSSIKDMETIMRALRQVPL